MRAKWLKFGILASIKVRASGQCIAPKTRTTLILDRYRQAPGFPERIIDSQNVFILIASRKDFARQNYKIQASLTRIS